MAIGCHRWPSEQDRHGLKFALLVGTGRAADATATPARAQVRCPHRRGWLYRAERRPDAGARRSLGADLFISAGVPVPPPATAWSPAAAIFGRASGSWCANSARRAPARSPPRPPAKSLLASSSRRASLAISSSAIGAVSPGLGPAATAAHSPLQRRGLVPARGVCLARLADRLRRRP